MKKDMRDRLHAVFIIVLFLALVLLDFKIGILIFIPSYYILKGLIAIRKKRMFLALTLASGIGQADSVFDRTEYQFTLKGKKAIKKGKILILYGVIIFAIEILMIVYLLINPV